MKRFNFQKAKDVYGRQMMAFYLNQHSSEVIEREDGYLDAGGLGGRNYYLSEYKDWAPFEKESMKYVKGKVLDIGCGAGRHALHLQKNSFDVTGIDLSPLAVQVCKLRGLKKAKVLPVEKISRLKAGAYDTLLMMGNNFGLFGSFKKAKRLLNQMRRVTTPKAVILAQTLDPYQTHDSYHLSYHKFNRKRGRMGGQIRLRVRYKNLIGPWFDYLFVSKKELQEILKNTGWCLKKVIPSKSSFYIAVIQKQ